MTTKKKAADEKIIGAAWESHSGFYSPGENDKAEIGETYKDGDGNLYQKELSNDRGAFWKVIEWAPPTPVAEKADQGGE